jgi:Ca-activated chloride channel family protein
MGAYNLGLAYYQSGDLAAAQLAFGEATKLDPENEAARANYDKLEKVLQETSQANMKDAEEAAPEKGMAEMERNKSMEELSGGGQKATKKDMEKQRLEETVNTDIRKAKELDEVPDNFETGKSNNQKVLLQKLDDDPALFLMRKFEYEVKKKKMKPTPNAKQW